MDIGWFCESCCGVVATEDDFNVSVFKQVGDFAYVWGKNEMGRACGAYVGGEGGV